MTISEAASRANNFDVLRLFAAVLVLVSHSFALAGRAEPTIGGFSLGGVGLYIFFAISGFLVTQSWMREPRLAPFFAKRALRILPALLAVSLLTAYVVGPFVTTLSLGQYFGDPATHAYALRNATLRTDYLLPGVFVHNPYPWVVNGSLWTLPVEVRAYAALAAVGLVVGTLVRRERRIGRLNGQHRFAILAVMVLVAVGLAAITLKLAGVHGAAFGLDLPSRSEVMGGFGQQLALFLVFGAGALLYFARSHVPLRWGASVALIAVWLIASHWKLGPGQLRSKAIPALVFPYLAVLIAFRGTQMLRRLTAWGDVSYGVYLWAFPIGQIIALAWGTASTPLLVIAVSLPLTYLAAAASWFTVERHALRLKPRGSHAVPPAGDPGHLDPAFAGVRPNPGRTEPCSQAS